MWLEIQDHEGNDVIRFPDVPPPALGEMVQVGDVMGRVIGRSLHFLRCNEPPGTEAVYRVEIRRTF